MAKPVASDGGFLQRTRIMPEIFFARAMGCKPNETWIDIRFSCYAYIVAAGHMRSGSPKTNHHPTVP